MQTMLVTKEKVLQELQTLDPSKWTEVLDFISLEFARKLRQQAERRFPYERRLSEP